MKLLDAMKVIAKKKEQQAAESVVETLAPTIQRKQSGNHRGIIHVMGINDDSEEYEEMSTKLERLARTNPTLYHKIVSLD